MTQKDRLNTRSGEGTSSKKSQKSILHYGAALPLATLMTVGLTLSMAGLIATEFTPQDKSETASFEINQKVEEIREIDRQEPPNALEKVDIPPPPPTIAVYQTAAVEVPFKELKGKKIELDIDRLDLGNTHEGIQIDKDPTPIIRVPPVFPLRFSQGNVSGYCHVRFDISGAGLPVNVETTLCTNKQLRAATVKSVQGWKYAPEIKNGRAVARTGLKTTIRFDLNDEHEKPLPLPSGF